MELRCPVNWTPKGYQKKFLSDMVGVKGQPGSGKKKALLVWSRQMGKDSSCGIYMFMEALRVPGNYFYTFPYSTDARKAFWEKIEEHTGRRFLDQIPKELIKRRSDQEMVLELVNGSIIRALGFDSDPEQARGLSPKGVVFSEAAQMDPRVFSNMEPAIAMNNAWVIYNSTPFGENHFYGFYKHALTSKDWHCSLVQTLYPDQPGYHYTRDPEYFQNLIDSGIMTKEAVAREYGCDWSTKLEGSIYGDNLRKAYEDGRVGEYPYDPNYPVNTFWDIGDIDDTVIWFGQTVRGKPFIIDYYRCTKPNPTDLAIMLLEKEYRYSTHVLPWDARYTRMGVSVEMQLSEAFFNLGVSGSTICADKASVQVGIQAVRQRFHYYHFNLATCADGLELLEQYRRKWDDREKKFKEEPIHNHPSSHTADALRIEAISTDLITDGAYGPIEPYKVITDDDY